ncbi:MAG: hypothetical protein ACI9YB_003259, partial [Halioglobus sp.]
MECGSPLPLYIQVLKNLQVNLGLYFKIRSFYLNFYLLLLLHEQ